LIAGVLGLFGLAVRLPYVGMIPVFTDGVVHTLYALSIQPGKFMRSKGLTLIPGRCLHTSLPDGCERSARRAAMQRILMAVMGALTVGLTFLLARALGLSRLGRRWPGC